MNSKNIEENNEDEILIFSTFFKIFKKNKKLILIYTIFLSLIYLGYLKISKNFFTKTYYYNNTLFLNKKIINNGEKFANNKKYFDNQECIPINQNTDVLNYSKIQKFKSNYKKFIASKYPDILNQDFYEPIISYRDNQLNIRLITSTEDFSKKLTNVYLSYLNSSLLENAEICASKKFQIFNKFGDSLKFDKNSIYDFSLQLLDSNYYYFIDYEEKKAIIKDPNLKISLVIFLILLIMPILINYLNLKRKKILIQKKEFTRYLPSTFLGNLGNNKKLNLLIVENKVFNNKIIDKSQTIKLIHLSKDNFKFLLSKSKYEDLEEIFLEKENYKELEKFSNIILIIKPFELSSKELQEISLYLNRFKNLFGWFYLDNI